MAKKRVNKLTEVLVVSAKELSLMLGISVRQIWRLRAAGQLPKPVYLGGSVKWRCLDIELFIDCGCDMELFNARKGVER